VDAIAHDTASAIIERLTGKVPAPQKVEAALNQIKA
jgi:F-type H+-transporting ATPase subunit b